jgi:hypothetical protein
MFDIIRKVALQSTIKCYIVLDARTKVESYRRLYLEHFNTLLQTYLQRNQKQLMGRLIVSCSSFNQPKSSHQLFDSN